MLVLSAETQAQVYRARTGADYKAMREAQSYDRISPDQKVFLADI